MELLDILLARRSVRQYTGDPIPEAQLERILQAGLLSPSGRNRKPWEFVVVRRRETLERLSRCRPGAAAMLAGAGCAIVVFADPEKTDVWTEDCSIAMSNMHLMAASLGLGSCWIQGRLRDNGAGKSAEAVCREILSVPDGYRLEAILSVGVAAEHPPAHTLDALDTGKIHFERF